MNINETYGETFFSTQKGGSYESAQVVVPIIMRLISPKSVIDVGCGVGTWLSVFKDKGVAEVTGVDGEWVDRAQLLIPEERFIPRNLEQPITIDTCADMAISLETGEHLSKAAADEFVKSLVALAPVVVFSAAVPHQGGVHHVNEQWPEYWEAFFKKYGYVAVDAIRRHVWDDRRVRFYYAQNMLIYVDKNKLDSYPLLFEEVRMGHDRALALVHPCKYVYFAERWESIVPFLGRIPPKLLHVGKALLKKIKRRK